MVGAATGFGLMFLAGRTRILIAKLCYFRPMCTRPSGKKATVRSLTYR
jgi:hypothetical protein